MFGSAKSKSPSLTDTVSDAAEQVRHWAEDVWQNSADRAAPGVDAASKVRSDPAHKAGDAASDFRGALQDDYTPTAAGRPAPAAGRSAAAITEAGRPAFVYDTVTVV